jgi:hypothetical protein
MPDTIPPLSRDLLRGAKAIAKHVFGDDSPEYVRRINRLIERGSLPVFKIDGFNYARKSDLDRFFSKKPDPE